MTYPDARTAFADADAKIERARAILAVAEPVVEGDPAWLYLVKTRRLPDAAVRAALGELRRVSPIIKGRPPQDHAVMSLLRDRSGEISGFQLTFCDILGAATGEDPKRQTYSLRQNGCRDGLFHAGGGAGNRCYMTEGYLEKAIACASLGLGPSYGAGGINILGYAIPPEPEVVIVEDRAPGR